VGQLQPQGRFLLPRDRTLRQRMFHCQLRRQGAAILRATDGLEPQPVRFSKAHGGVHRPP
jgi:hypothetical protein